MRRDPCEGHRFPRGISLLAVRWYCRFPLSYQDVADLLAERGITVDRITVFRWGLLHRLVEIRRERLRSHEALLDLALRFDYVGT